MKRIQKVIDLINQTDFKYDKQKIEVTLSQSGKKIEAQLVISAVGNSRRNVITTLNYNEDEYDYQEAVDLLEDQAITYMCSLGATIIANRGKTTAV